MWDRLQELGVTPAQLEERQDPDPLWQCFLWNSASGPKDNNRHSRKNDRVSTIDTTGLDAAKLQCCSKAVTTKCRNLCIRSLSRSDLHGHCRQSHEPNFYNCLGRREDGHKCCSHASTDECRDACSAIFDRDTTPTPADRKAINEHCLHHHNKRVLKCVENYSKTTPASNPMESIHCCEKSHSEQCRQACQQVLRNFTTEQEIMDGLVAGCGLPFKRPQVRCKMGEVSEFMVSKGTFVRIPTPNNDVDFRDPGCFKLCQCTDKGILEACVNMPCSGARTCVHGDQVVAHNTQWGESCNLCVCYDGAVICSNRQCGPAMTRSAGSAPSFTGLPCNCPEHYVPVCAVNGRTYPSACIARCAGLEDAQFVFGTCASHDPCRPTDPCEAGLRCVPRRQTCLLNPPGGAEAAVAIDDVCPQYVCVPQHLNCGVEPYDAGCGLDDRTTMCQFIRKRGEHKGECVQKCSGDGAVCGRNGETYSSECSAWADRVSVDYRGPCTAVGQLTLSDRDNPQCSSIVCPELPTRTCRGIIPPGTCCPVCGGEVRIIISRSQAEHAARSTGGAPLSVRFIAEKLRTHITVPECDVFGYLSIESEMVILVTPVTEKPTPIQIEACHTEAHKMELMIRSGSPTLLSDLTLSPLVTARVRTSVVVNANASASHRLSMSLLAVTCLVVILHRLASLCS
ncbi:PREDICTED: reversion-inducing cysteine-rich protein with Kazal motifs-like [Priapulus caudatus]|uniref:Reversion-inducing cysteine-rich protein with Kazal motifs-like n=1 Tax=Priapulus caudatus TaxID=37621 RepID=A0ABM1EVW6_PRICU|nr:PREDICTED: reversion-inducing cysteine-rich protein with Kazal motifs-like [Priapulus caudatus]